MSKDTTARPEDFAGDVAELMDRSKRRGDVWRAIMDKLNAKHKAECEALRVRHLAEQSDAWREHCRDCP